MATPLAGLSGLYGKTNPEQPIGVTGRPETDWGTPADSRHGVPGGDAHEKNTRGTGYGPEQGFPSEFNGSEAPRGDIWDSTPTSHAAPFPPGAQQDLVAYSDTMRTLHGAERGGSTRRSFAPTPYEFHINAVRSDSPYESDLAENVPGQLKSGPGGKGTSQGYGVPNGYGFNLGRQFRRAQTDRMPFDRTGVHSEERPFWGKHPTRVTRFDGPDSPFAQQGDTSQGMNLAPTPVGYATPYQQPPSPTVAPEVGYDTEAPMWGEGWVA